LGKIVKMCAVKDVSTQHVNIHPEHACVETIMKVVIVIIAPKENMILTSIA
jgi:hypothetical protein